ncbi:MAG: ATP-binding cassette domain-containing protein [Bacteroidaceae bacterium]|nr:ATP-binding cassette domain-containing protein [Bacteroidaceae bacterium]
MNTIRLEHTFPEVFAKRSDLHSEVWQQDVTLERGKLYLVEASSGTGKSSLCSFIYGYRRDYQGMISFDGANIRNFKTKDWTNLRQRHLSLMWQELRLFPELTAIENVQIKNRLTGFKGKKQIRQWFEELGIADKMDTKVGIMSFGQQQRVALMRALVQPMDFLFVDEPVSHLDDTNARIMADIMMEEATRQGAGVVVTSIGKHVDLNYDKTLRL